MRDESVGDDEEELRVGAERVPPRVQRPLTVVLVALLGLGGAYLATRGNDDNGTSAAPSTSSTVSARPSDSTSVLPVPRAGGFPLPSSSRVPVCPAGRRCLTTDYLPAAVVSALRDRYPGARVTSARTLVATGDTGATLLRRSIKAVAGARRFDIVVTPFILGPDDFDRADSATTSTFTVESTGSGKSVQLLLTEPRTDPPDDLTVLRLARDPRLTALR